jgi:hypothetical protein
MCASGNFLASLPSTAIGAENGAAGKSTRDRNRRTGGKSARIALASSACRGTQPPDTSGRGIDPGCHVLGPCRSEEQYLRHRAQVCARNDEPHSAAKLGAYIWANAGRALKAEANTPQGHDPERPNERPSDVRPLFAYLGHATKVPTNYG